MFYLLFIGLALVIFFIFRSTTRQYHSWDVIKERWFQVGLDNALLFSSGTPQQGKELLRLDGEHSGYSVALSILKDSRPRVMVEVRYPSELSKKLSLYPDAAFININKILKGELSSTDDAVEPIHQEINNRSFNKRLHPQIAEQLLLLQQQYRRMGRSFELNSEKLSYYQEGLLHDPTLLFPVLDEMVTTVNLINENMEHLLVQ